MQQDSCLWESRVCIRKELVPLTKHASHVCAFCCTSSTPILCVLVSLIVRCAQACCTELPVVIAAARLLLSSVQMNTETHL